MDEDLCGVRRKWRKDTEGVLVSSYGLKVSVSPPSSCVEALIVWQCSLWKIIRFICLGFPGGSIACNTGDLDSIPGSGRYPGEGIGNPLQYSCLENSTDRGA